MQVLPGARWTTILIPLAAATAIAAAAAAADPPTLVVPAGKLTLQVAVDLPAEPKLPAADAWQLVELESPQVKIPAQRVTAVAADGSPAAKAGRLVAAIPPREGAGTTRRFRLEPASSAPCPAPAFQFTDLHDKTTKLSDGPQPVMAYNFGMITDPRVPEKDSRRTRACYIHPVWGISGEVLTDDFPKDHYHHHGLFWSWPHVGIEGKEYDLWVYRNITPKFVSWICREVGPVAAVLAVENGWFVGEKKVMIERVWMRAYKVAEDSRSLDLEFIWVPVDKPVTLWGAGGKSYGGLTARFLVRNSKEAVITVPSGRTKEDLPDTRLEWADLTTKLEGAPGPSGAAVFVHPQHPDYPPSWLTRHYGPLCVGWPGVKPQTFAPGQPIRLAYRFWIHKTALEVEPLKSAYEGYKAAAGALWQ